MADTIPAADVAQHLAGLRDAIAAIGVRVGSLDSGPRADAVARAVCDALSALDSSTLLLLECESGDLGDFGSRDGTVVDLYNAVDRLTPGGGRTK